MQMIVSPIKRAMLTHNLVSADRTLSDLLASVMASVGFGLILVTADRVLFTPMTRRTLSSTLAAASATNATASVPWILHPRENYNPS